MSKWDWVYDLKAKETAEVIVDELGKVLSEEMLHWPPKLDWLNGGRERFAVLVDPRGQKPDTTAVVEALRIVRWELERDFGALDHYHRNDKLRSQCSSPVQRELALFLYEYIREAFAEIFERTEGKVKRVHAVAGLPKLQVAFVRAFQS